MTLGIALRSDGEGTMNATRLIEEWRRQGRVLEVEGGEHGFVADGPGRDRYLCFMGFPLLAFVIESFYRN